MVPINTPDYSSYILKIRQANPDFVYLNLADIGVTAFLRQYRQSGLAFPLVGGVMDTVPFWQPESRISRATGRASGS